MKLTARGHRVVEILEQAQYKPLPVVLEDFIASRAGADPDRASHEEDGGEA